MPSETVATFRTGTLVAFAGGFGLAVFAGGLVAGRLIFAFLAALDLVLLGDFELDGLADFLDALDFAFDDRFTVDLSVPRFDAAFLDFLRVFLDIRLPFVAFGTSLIGVPGTGAFVLEPLPTAGQI